MTSSFQGEIGTVLDHARGDLRNIGNFGAAQARRVAGAHLLRLGREGEARGAETAAATAGTRPASRSVRGRDAVMCATIGWPARRRVVDAYACLNRAARTVTSVTPLPDCDVRH
jgi:hypothetical protein